MAMTPESDTATRVMTASRSIDAPDVTPTRRPLPRWGAAALAAVAVASVLLALTLAEGGGGEGLKTPPAGGSLSQQLDQLDDSIDRARP
jgi:hypothetical protein